MRSSRPSLALLSLILTLLPWQPASAQAPAESEAVVALRERFATYRQQEHQLGQAALTMRRAQERFVRARAALSSWRAGKDPNALTAAERKEVDALEAELLAARQAYGALADGEVGRTYQRLKGDVDAALKGLAHDLGLALQKSEDPLLRRMRANLLVDKGHFDMAEGDLERVLAARPQDAVALTLRGRCREARGATEHALEDYQAALKLTPSDERRLRAAVACFWLNRFVEARELRDQVKALEALPAQVQLDHAWYLAAPKLEDAEKRWQRELALRHGEVERGDLPRVTLETTRGKVVIELFEDSAPRTVAAFLHLIEQGFYDGLTWHRVQPLRLAVTGRPRQPIGRDDEGPGWATPNELGQDARQHFRGSVGWLPRGPEGRGGSQLYLSLRPDPELDGRCLVIGRVVEGIEHVAALRQGDLVDKAKVLRKRAHPYELKKEGL
ncbi:MAG: peptidylprolyl isomerase [Planctomycetota bacterium]